MPAELPPYMNAYGNIERILNKMKVAATPPRFTQDFLSTELGFSGGSAKAFIPFAKRLNLIGTDGTPTELYKKFRNDTESKRAIAQAMRHGYATLFKRNEYANSLSKEELEGLVAESTGLEKKSNTLGAIVASFSALRKFADFKQDGAAIDVKREETVKENRTRDDGEVEQRAVLGLTYAFNLVLPNTTEIAVFNAIFKSLRENLL